MEAFYKANHIRIYNKDCWSMIELPPESVDLIATDPPYGISFMGKDWDTFNEVVPPQGAYQSKKGFKKLPRQSTQSMAEFFIPIWKECLRILKPGAFAFVMCSPRADVMAKQVICLREAGFEVGFTPIYWTYASGFPKAQNIGKRSRNAELKGSYAGFQPKPAVEVILVAMRPLSEKTYIDQALKNRKGITWLDDCRIPYQKQDKPSAGNRTATFAHQETVSGGDGSGGFDANPQGRFPANLLVSDDVLNDGKITKSEGGKTTRGKENKVGEWGYKEFNMQGYGDSGSFSRYFDLDKWAQKTFPFLIVPKASKSEKNKGLDYEPQPIVRRDNGQDVRNVLQKARSTPRINQHPTVKPVKLMSYLITLGSREGDTVVDPFIGTGSMAIACQILGRKCTGYEINANYCEIAKSRLTYYCQKAMNL